MSTTLFPGVSQKDLDEQMRLEKLKKQEEVRKAEEAKRKAEEERKSQEAAQAAASKKVKREQAYRKFVEYKDTSRTPFGNHLKNLAARVGISTGLMLFIWLFSFLGVSSEKGFNEWHEENKSCGNRKYPSLKQDLRDRFWPISNGWVVEKWGYPDYEAGYGWYTAHDRVYTYDENNKGKFIPRGIWFIDMAFLLVDLMFVLGTMGVVIKEGKQIRKAKSFNKISEKAVDMMANLKELGKKYNLNSKQVAEIVKKVPDIISKMSAEERVYFDMLMNDNISIKNKETFRDMAVAIMQGYLQKHPEDFALVLNKFDEKSIPQILIQQYRDSRQA